MPDELTDILKRFDEAFDRGDLHNACALLGEARALTGNRPDILAGHGHLLLTTGQGKAAEEAAWKALAIEPGNDEALKLLGRVWAEKGPFQDGLQRLPGSKYAKYALPLDYPPSRRLAPRWGYSEAPHQGLSALFDRSREDYKTIIADLRTLVPFFAKIRTEYTLDRAGEPGWVGPPVNTIDLALLYYFVWKYRPKTYLEIGSGSTTSFARRAVSDHQIPAKIISIDPEPRSSIDAICDHVIRSGLETLDSLQIFADLEPGDIVFLDGSHRCFMNSDVTVFFLNVIPLLKPGVIIHIHDISLPLDYDHMFTDWYWNEQYILAAYLLGLGDRAQILMPSQYIGIATGIKELLHPVLLPGVGDPRSWLAGGSFWFTHK